MMEGSRSFFHTIFRRKPITKDVDKDSKLKRVLDLVDIIGFGCAITGIIMSSFYEYIIISYIIIETSNIFIVIKKVGSGVYVITGEAGKYAGPSLFMSFIIGGVSCLFCGLCYGEFATRIPGYIYMLYFTETIYLDLYALSGKEFAKKILVIYCEYI